MLRDVVRVPKFENNKWVVEYRDLGSLREEKFDTKEEAWKFYQAKVNFFRCWYEKALEYFRDRN